MTLKDISYAQFVVVEHPQNMALCHLDFRESRGSISGGWYFPIVSLINKDYTICGLQENENA